MRSAKQRQQQPRRRQQLQHWLPSVRGVTCTCTCCFAVAYGVIAGLVSFLAIHVPFWLWDKLMQWWQKQRRRGQANGDGGSPLPRTPRSTRMRRQRHSGYFVRKLFKMSHNGSGAMENASTVATRSYADDSYHSTDSRRSALPPFPPLAPGGGGPAVMVGPGFSSGQAMHRSSSMGSLHVSVADPLPAQPALPAQCSRPVPHRLAFLGD